jgi:hypothetical protein
LPQAKRYATAFLSTTPYEVVLLYHISQNNARNFAANPSTLDS